jgi:hypothetical protein
LTIDLNHGSGFVPGHAGATAPSLSEQINTRIDAALRQARAAEPRRTYIGASMLGDPCARRIAYAWHGASGAPPEGLSLRIFETGHALEGLLAQWVKRAGFDLLTVAPPTGEQFTFRDGPIEGHADGIIVGGPDLGFDYPVLWEAKGLNDRSWNDLVKNGLQASKPIYYGQCSLYMAYLELNSCLFSALNKDNQQLYHELVWLDLAEAQRLVDLAVDIARGGLPPRAWAEPTRLCAYCQFASSCWKEV